MARAVGLLLAGLAVAVLGQPIDNAYSPAPPIWTVRCRVRANVEAAAAASHSPLCQRGLLSLALLLRSGRTRPAARLCASAVGRCAVDSALHSALLSCYFAVFPTPSRACERRAFRLLFLSTRAARQAASQNTLANSSLSRLFLALSLSLSASSSSS